MLGEDPIWLTVITIFPMGETANRSFVGCSSSKNGWVITVFPRSRLAGQPHGLTRSGPTFFLRCSTFCEFQGDGVL